MKRPLNFSDNGTAVVRVEGDSVDLDLSRTWLDLSPDEAQQLANALLMAADEARGHVPFDLNRLRHQLGLQDKSDEYLNAGLDRLADAVLGDEVTS